MDDFLYNLRKSVEERNKSGNRHADGNTNRSGDRRCGMDRRNRRPQKQHSNDRRSYPPYNRNLHEIRVLLEKMLVKQGLQQEINEKRLVLEERRTVAMERIVDRLMGQSLDTPVEASPPPTLEASAPAMPEPGDTGTTSQAIASDKAAKADEPATAGELMTTLRAEGKSYEKIANALEAAGFPTVSGRGRWRGQTVKRELAKLGVTG